MDTHLDVLHGPQLKMDLVALVFLTLIKVENVWRITWHRIDSAVRDRMEETENRQTTRLTSE